MWLGLPGSGDGDWEQASGYYSLLRASKGLAWMAEWGGHLALTSAWQEGLSSPTLAITNLNSSHSLLGGRRHKS